MSAPSGTQEGGAARRRQPRMRRYHVTYVVTRAETYGIEAANAAAAEERAFSDGELVDTGETTSVHELDTEIVPSTDAARKSPLKAKLKRLRPWNLRRAKWARAAVDVFVALTGTEEEDVLCDLLCDLMHLADRVGWGFQKELDRALYHYEAEQTEP